VVARAYEKNPSGRKDLSARTTVATIHAERWNDETLLEVTRFFRIAMNTSSIKHMYFKLSDVSKNLRCLPCACSISTTYELGLGLDIRAICYYGSQLQDLEEAANSYMGPKSATLE